MTRFWLSPSGHSQQWFAATMNGFGTPARAIIKKVQDTMEQSLKTAISVLRSQPFSVLLNANITSFERGLVELRLPISSQVKQQHGFVHGGVVSYAADNALTFAGGTALGPAVVTAEFKINYLRPAEGDELVARARVVHAGRTQTVCQCEVFAVTANKETLCALAQGTISVLGRPTKTEVTLSPVLAHRG